MGGNALKNTHTRRYDKFEYFVQARNVLEKFKTAGLRAELIVAYDEKETFGDMDIIVQFEPEFDYMYFVQSFNPKEIYKNGKVISFEYEELQIDMIITKSEFFEFSRVYYSFNDLGNLMGRVAHKLGMKYGHEGLFYTYRDLNNNILGTILLSRTPIETFKILGYDYETFQRGFKNLQEIFEYASSSKFFNKNIFNLDNRNHKARTRDKKRPTYTAFLKYCESRDFKNNFQYDEDKTTYWYIIQEYFPHFIDEISSIQKKDEARQKIKEKFNGKIVMKLTELSGKELGAFMARFRKMHSNAEIIHATPETIREWINKEPFNE